MERETDGGGGGDKDGNAKEIMKASWLVFSPSIPFKSIQLLTVLQAKFHITQGDVT